MMTKIDEDELREHLSTIIAGETINWNSFERYMAKAMPLTLSTLIKAVRAESYLSAIQDKVLSPGMKIALGTIFAIMIVAAIIWIIIQGGL